MRQSAQLQGYEPREQSSATRVIESVRLDAAYLPLRVLADYAARPGKHDRTVRAGTRGAPIVRNSRA